MRTALKRVYVVVGWIGFLLLILNYCEAQAQPICRITENLEERLRADYDETRVWQGIALTGDLMVLYQSGDGTSWTLTIASPNGTSCLVAAGQYGEKIVDDDAGPDL